MKIKNILVTRPISATLAEELQIKGFELLVHPFIAVETVPFRSPEMEYDLLAFTSHRSVWAFVRHCKVPEGVMICALSGKTAQTARESGLEPDITAPNAAELARIINQQFQNKSILHPSGNLSLPDLKLVLEEGGNTYVPLKVYDTVLTPKKIESSFEAVAFFSPSAVDSFFQLNDFNADVLYACAGETTRAAVLGHFPPAKTLVPSSPFPDLLFEGIINYN